MHAEESVHRRSPMLWVPTLYFAEGLPFFAVAVIASLMYKSMGVANDQITHWTGLLGLAWAFKPLWSPVLEAAQKKKTQVVIFECAGAVALALVAASLHVSGWFAASLAMLGLMALAAATHDIAADGLYISSLDSRQRAEYAGWQGAFFNAGKFMSLGGLPILAGFLERRMDPALAWTVIFALAAAMMAALAAYHVWALPEGGKRLGAVTTDSAAATVPPGAAPAGVWATLVDVVVEFFRKPGIVFAVLFIVLFRAGEGQVQAMGPLFLRDPRALGGLGLSTDEVGWVYGTVGTVAFLLGSVCGGYFTSWLGLRRAMPFLILAVNLPNLVFYFLSAVQPQELTTVAAALSVEMVGYGFGFVGLILFIMQFVASGKYQTAHYALGTGVMQLGFVFFKMISGDIEAALGYRNFFLWVLISAVPVLVLSRFLRMEDRAAMPPAPAPATAAQA